jgi:hypothetical protein
MIFGLTSVLLLINFSWAYTLKVPLDYIKVGVDYCVQVNHYVVDNYLDINVLSVGGTSSPTPSVIKHIWILTGGPGQGSVILDFWKRANVLVHSMEFRRPSFNSIRESSFTTSWKDKYITTSHAACDMLEAIKDMDQKYPNSKNEHYIHGISYGTMWAERIRKFDTQNRVTAYILEGIVDSTEKVSFEKIIGNNYADLNVIKSCARDEKCRKDLKNTLGKEDLDKILEAIELDHNTVNDGSQLIEYSIAKDFISEEIVKPFLVSGTTEQNVCRRMFYESTLVDLSRLACFVFQSRQIAGKYEEDLRMGVIYLQNNIAKCPEPMDFYFQLKAVLESILKNQKVALPRASSARSNSVWSEMNVSPLPEIVFEDEPLYLGSEIHEGLYCLIVGNDMQPESGEEVKVSMFHSEEALKNQAELTSECRSLVSKLGTVDGMNIDDKRPSGTQNMYLMQGFLDINTPHKLAKKFYETINARNESGEIVFVEYMNGGHNPFMTSQNICQYNLVDDILANSGKLSSDTIKCVNEVNSLPLNFDLRDGRKSFNLYTKLGGGYLLIVYLAMLFASYGATFFLKRFIKD